DLNSHFEMLNNTKINKQEIEQVWSAIKNMTRYRDNVSKSTLEIAREAGWDETVYQLETRVVTAIATLEDIGYIRRGHNSPKVFANSILAKSVIEANKTIDNSYLFDNKDKTNAKRIMGSLISNKYQIKIGDSIPEIRVDYLSDILGVPKEDIIRCINLLREAKLLTDDKDLYTQIKYGSKPIQAIKTTKLYANIINHLLVLFSEESKTYNTKAINEDLINKGYEHKLLDVIKAINYLEFTQFIKMKKESKDTLKIHLVNKKDQTIDRFRKITTLGSVIINFIYVKVNEKRENENIVNFSLLEVTKYVNNIQSLFQETYVLNDIQEALLYLTKINALQIEGGFFVIYSPLYIERIEKNNAKQFTNQDYNKLLNHYENKKQQIHIVGEYATKVVDNYKNSLIFVNDYFTLEYKDFLNKYFPGERRKDLEKNMSPKRFKELFGTLSTNQLAVIQDKTHKRIAVAAGPGSGKTRLLVHKLASIISTEDIRSEQLLMLTFSRAAVSEFKERLINLVGKAATYIKITTFLSYAFDILGKQGNIDNTINIIKEATDLINSREVNPVSATKMVLVIDEAQDMNEEEYNLVQALINYNESIRIIAVGDDDQNIFEWRGSNCRYFTKISEEEQAFYELPINYRSKNNLVDFANQLIKKVKNRLKKQPIQSFTNANGHIKITKYTNNNLVIPVVKDILNARLKGTTCIITRTNEQAILIAGLLNHYGKKAELIQTSVDILLYNIFELRTFFNFIEKYNQEIITDKMWNESIQMFKDTFKNSINFNLSQLILDKFRNIAGDNPYR
ncbi:MAG: AAA family ATPase, partial [Acholeplasmataceae bacterium]|nr:AAA family ATPase [Acholeplasmataceae bacterium]